MRRKELGWLAQVEREVDALLAKGCTGMSLAELQRTHSKLSFYMRTIIMMRRKELRAIVNKETEKNNEASN